MRSDEGKMTNPKRALRMHAAFTPPSADRGAELGEFSTFRDLFNEARELRHRNQSKDLRAKKRRLQDCAPFMPKVGNALRAYFAEKIDAEAVARRIRKICPEEQLQRKILDLFAAGVSTPKMTDEELAREERDIARGKKVLSSIGAKRN